MARYRFPGRPGQRIGRNYVTAFSYNTKLHVDLPLIRPVSNRIEKGLNNFYELFGTSDEEGEFDGFSIEEQHGSKVQHRRKRKKVTLLSIDPRDEHHHTHQLEKTCGSSCSLSRRRLGMRHLVRKSYDKMIKEGLCKSHDILEANIGLKNRTQYQFVDSSDQFYSQTDCRNVKPTALSNKGGEKLSKPKTLPKNKTEKKYSGNISAKSLLNRAKKSQLPVSLSKKHDVSQSYKTVIQSSSLKREKDKIVSRMLFHKKNLKQNHHVKVQKDNHHSVFSNENKFGDKKSFENVYQKSDLSVSHVLGHHSSCFRKQFTVPSISCNSARKIFPRKSFLDDYDSPFHYTESKREKLRSKELSKKYNSKMFMSDAEVNEGVDTSKKIGLLDQPLVLEGKRPWKPSLKIQMKLSEMNCNLFRLKKTGDYNLENNEGSFMHTKQDMTSKYRDMTKKRRGRAKIFVHQIESKKSSKENHARQVRPAFVLPENEDSNVDIVKEIQENKLKAKCAKTIGKLKTSSDKIPDEHSLISSVQSFKEASTGLINLMSGQRVKASHKVTKGILRKACSQFNKRTLMKLRKSCRIKKASQKIETENIVTKYSSDMTSSALISLKDHDISKSSEYVSRSVVLPNLVYPEVGSLKQYFSDSSVSSQFLSGRKPQDSSFISESTHSAQMMSYSDSLEPTKLAVNDSVQSSTLIPNGISTVLIASGTHGISNGGPLEPLNNVKDTTGVNPNEGVRSGQAGTITCVICGLVKSYSRVQRRFHQFSCESCSKFFISFIKKPKQYYCSKQGCCPILPCSQLPVGVKVSVQCRLRALESRCRACWLRACCEKFFVSKRIKEDILKYAPKVESTNKLMLTARQMHLVEPKKPIALNNLHFKNITKRKVKQAQRLSRLSPVKQKILQNKKMNETKTVDKTLPNYKYPRKGKKLKIQHKPGQDGVATCVDTRVKTNLNKVTKGVKRQIIKKRKSKSSLVISDSVQIMSSSKLAESVCKTEHSDLPRVEADSFSKQTEANAVHEMKENDYFIKPVSSESKQKQTHSEREVVVRKGPRTKHVCRRAAVALGLKQATFPTNEKKTRKTGHTLKSREVVARKGPRIKHVCRRAAVALGLKQAKFPVGKEKKQFSLSALPVDEKEKVVESEAQQRVSDHDDFGSLEVNSQPFSNAGKYYLEGIIKEKLKNNRKVSLSSKKNNKIPYKTSKVSNQLTKKYGQHSDRVRKVRCKNCEGCLAVECGRCNYCLDKKKFGGPNVIKQACKYRRCLRPQMPTVNSIIKGLPDDTSFNYMDEYGECSIFSTVESALLPSCSPNFIQSDYNDSRSNSIYNNEQECDLADTSAFTIDCDILSNEIQPSSSAFDDAQVIESNSVTDLTCETVIYDDVVWSDFDPSLGSCIVVISSL
ncbi:uncharacterized protein LOC143222536 isoform X1 [Tachypleus tridentatus]|uniref:uncharacterized protein LOC143222536 isoform X1 n=1 Tax=Tachypleus tridentatus TaxID=6853 RepID=UPI003FD4C7B7